jgi:acetyl-CoA C-acetyltransferase
MHMNKHIFATYSTTPATLTPPDDADVAARAAMAHTPIVESFDGPARVASYSVIHGRDGSPESAVLICDVSPASGASPESPPSPAGGGGNGTARCYARLTDPAGLEAAESEELIGRPVTISPDGNGGNTANL